MWNIRHNHEKIQIVDMRNPPLIDCNGEIPKLKQGIKYLNAEDNKIYEFCGVDWILSEEGEKMINIKTECKDCRHDQVCKYKEDWTKQAEAWRADKNKETLVSDNIMIAVLECRLYSPPTYTGIRGGEQAICSTSTPYPSY